MTPRLSSRSTLTAMPSAERTSLTGTSNAISRVVTRWVSARTGLTRWIPSVSTRSWRPPFTTRPDGARRDADEDPGQEPDDHGGDGRDDDHGAQREEQRQEQTGRAERDREEDPLDLDRRLALDAHDDRDPAIRVALLERVAGIDRRRDRLGDLDVRRGDRLRGVGVRGGLRLGRGREGFFGHGVGSPLGGARRGGCDGEGAAAGSGRRADGAASVGRVAGCWASR